MVLVYVPHHAPIESSPCPVHSGVVATVPSQTPPGAPRIGTVRLPGSPSGNGMPNVYVEDTYPLELSSNLTAAQQVTLETIELRSPIHLHTPASHIGTLLSTEAVSALDAVQHLRDEVVRPIDFHLTYSKLLPDMKARVEGAFRDRNGGSSNVLVAEVWNRFVSGLPTHSLCTFPAGCDLLLGNREVWGFDSWSFGGYSIVHLDRRS